MHAFQLMTKTYCFSHDCKISFFSIFRTFCAFQQLPFTFLQHITFQSPFPQPLHCPTPSQLHLKHLFNLTLKH